MSNTASGIIMLIGMALCSPISAGFALMGSFVSTMTALGLGASTQSVNEGLWGFSATLTSIALGGNFFVLNSWACFLYAVVGSMFTAIMHGATAGFMAPFGLPGFTFPFNAIAWLFCLAGPSLGCLLPVDLSRINRPEDHIRRYKLIQMMIALFDPSLHSLDYFSIKTP